MAVVLTCMLTSCLFKSRCRTTRREFVVGAPAAPVFRRLLSRTLESRHTTYIDITSTFQITSV